MENRHIQFEVDRHTLKYLSKTHFHKTLILILVAN